MGKLVSNIILFLILIVAQVVIFNNICLFNIALPFIFIYFIIKLPISININISLTIAFVMGLIIDIFSNTQGMNSLSCVIIMFIRKELLRLYVPREEDIVDGEVSIKTIGFTSFFKYSLTIVFLYCVVVFSIEAFTFFNIMHLVLKIISSTILSFILILGVDRITTKRREKRL